MIDKIIKIMFNGAMATIILALAIIAVMVCYIFPVVLLILTIMGVLGLIMNYLGWDMA